MIFKPSIFTKIYLSSLTIILCTALFIGLRSDRILQDNFVSQMKSSLEEKLDRAEVKLRPGLLRESILEIRDATSEFAQSENVGVTVFDWKGSILADSRDDINNYDNQPIRKEVHQVLKEDYSFHIRFSPPMDSRAMFIARKQEEVHETIGSIRLSSSLAPLAKKSMSLLMEIAAITLVIGLFAIVPSAFVSWFLTKPINFLRRRAEGFNLKRIRKDNSIHRRDEIGELARAQDEMAEKFQNALNETSHEKELSSSILSAMLEGVIALDTQERVTYMNLKAAEILETDPDTSLSKPFWEVTRKLEIRNEILKALKGELRGTVEVNLLRDRGDLFLKLHISHLFDDDKKISGIVVLLQDITKLQNLADHRAELVTNVAHEFKTPLTVISGISETLLDDPQMPEAPRNSFIAKISNQAKRLTDLSSDMLELSRVEIKKNGLDKAIADLRPIFKDTYESFKTNCKNDRIKFIYSEPQEKLLANIDRQAIFKIANNLIDNAVKYSPNGGDIYISLSDESNKNVIVVADTGIGIEPMDIDKIFQRFYRTDRARSPQTHGTGLGLAIVKNIVEAHSGTINVESIPGKGSSFRVELPKL